MTQQMHAAAALTPVPTPVSDRASAPTSAVRPAPHTASTPAWVGRYRTAALTLDLIVALAATGCAIAFGSRAQLVQTTSSTNVVLLLLVPTLWVAMLGQAGAYERRLLGVGADEFRTVPRASVRVLALAAVVAFLAHEAIPSAAGLLVLVGLPVAIGGSLLLRHALHKHLSAARITHGAAMQRAVVVGARDAAKELLEGMRREPQHGLRPVATCSTPTGSAHPVRSLADEALRTVDSLRADVVVLAHPCELSPQQVRRLSWALEERGVELLVSPGITEVAGPRLSIRPSASLTLLHVERPTLTGGARASKVVFDRVAAAVLTTLALPVLAAVAIAIKLDSRGPVLFRQTRVGAGGKTFRIVKFRSMTPEAESRLSEVQGSRTAGNSVLFKSEDDPRTTRVGRVLRRFSLDELPQLLNVLRGEMSLVGPRPPLQSEVAGYEPDAIRRLRVRPGMTGLWQVSGRSNLPWDESLRLDLRYVDNWSMMLDLQILWRTIRAVRQGEGAY